MRRLALLFQAVAALLSIAAAIRYITASEFMPYHAAVAGQEWATLAPGVQTIILGMLRILAGGFLAVGIALAALALPVRRGERWASWATLLVGAAVWAPTLSVTFMLKSAQPIAQPPTAPTLVILVLVVGASALGLLARPTGNGGT